MMTYDLLKLSKLSDGKVNLMEYSESDRDQWKNGNISMLTSSLAPEFVKAIIKHKKRKESSRHLSLWYFGEAFVASKLAHSVKEGWFCSFKWLYDPNWVNGKNPNKEKDEIIAGLKRQFYDSALLKYIGEDRLRDLQSIGKKGKMGLPDKPKAPDLWLIDKKGKSHFIEIKRAEANDTPSDAQLAGLALIEKCLKSPVHLVWLYKSGGRIPGNEKFSEYINKFVKFRKLV
jgi:hypothetical protein